MSLETIERRMLRQHDTSGGSARSPAVRVLLDFDGTVTLADSVDCLLEEFASTAWRDIEKTWESGLIGSRVCLEQQTALLRATPERLDLLIDTIAVDAGFLSLIRCCRDLGVELMIVSDGYDRVIRRVLERMSVSLPFVSNALHAVGRDEWRLTSPSAKADCRVDAGHCKCARVPDSSAVVLIGDGRSDFCVAHAADFVIGKPRLARYCEQQHLSGREVTDLAEAAEVLRMWMAMKVRPSRKLTSGEMA